MFVGIGKARSHLHAFFLELPFNKYSKNSHIDFPYSNADFRAPKYFCFYEGCRVVKVIFCKFSLVLLKHCAFLHSCIGHSVHQGTLTLGHLFLNSNIQNPFISEN